MITGHNRQGGLSTFATIAAFVGLGVTFLILVLLSSSSQNNSTNNPQSGEENQQTEETTNKEPPYIRIPENSKIYHNDTFGFLFAYPDSFGELERISGAAAGSLSYRAESGLAAQKPVGNGTAVMNGRLSVYVFNKDDFKIVVNSNDVSVGPAKTGNDTTWKIVSRGSSGQDISIGDAYSVKSLKSQTDVTIFDFAYTPASNLTLGRWVFEAGNKYVMITMPSVSKIDGSTLDQSDISAYTTIGTNIAKTIRVTTSTSSDADSQPQNDTNPGNN